MASLEIQFKYQIAILLGIFCSLCYASYDDEDRIIMFKEPVANKAMKNHVIRIEVVPNEGACRVLCYMEPNCVSINLGPLEEGKYKCELNNATEENQFTIFFVNEPTFTYLAIENPCVSSPCLNNGTCQAGFTSKGFRCICRAGISGTDCGRVYRNCAEIYKSGERSDGVYTIKPDNLPAFDVFCDQTTAGGGWTVFQKRFDGSVDFFLNWSDYKHGFGDLEGEFWLGNDKIHHLSSNGDNKLRVDLADFERNTVYAVYDMFRVMNENDKYTLKIVSYSGTAGDSLNDHRDQPFSTKDRDNDNWEDNCASKRHGAWWYKSCHHSNLNGIYHQSNPCPFGVGMSWKDWKGQQYSLKRTQMKIRPVDY